MSKQQTPNRFRGWAPPLVLALLALVQYYPAITFEFTGYDDPDYVTKNPYVQKGLTVETVAWAFTTGHTANWHPLTWLSHALDWQIAGSDPRIHHAANVGLHAANAALLFVLLFRATGAIWPSACVAALFAVHPLNVQSVAWIAERKNVLCMFFGLISLIAYVEYARAGRRAWLIASCAGLALGLMSKPMIVTWPFVMLLLDYWPLARIKAPMRDRKAFAHQTWALCREKAAFFALVLASSVVTYLVQSTGGAMGTGPGIPPVQRIANAAVSYLAYIGKTVWPFGLAAFYPHPLDTLPVWKPVAAVLFLLAVSFVIVSKAPEHRYLATGWFLYLGTLVPVIGFVQVGAQAMADRYAYVPIIGLLVMFAWGTQDLARRLALRRSVLWVAWTVVVGLLMARSWNELPHWRNSVTLWEHAAAVTDNNYFAHNNLGNEYAHQGKPDLALAEFKKALLIEPGFASAYANIGAIQLGQGLLADARKSLETAVHLEPENANAQLNLGIVCMRMNDFGAAMDHARAALELLPYDPQAHTLAGVLFDLLGKKDDAVRELRHALELDPAYERARVNLDRIMRAP